MAYLLVFLGADFLQEVCHALPLWQTEPQAVKEGDHLVPGTVINHAPCPVHTAIALATELLINCGLEP